MTGVQTCALPICFISYSCFFWHPLEFTNYDLVARAALGFFVCSLLELGMAPCTYFDDQNAYQLGFAEWHCHSNPDHSIYFPTRNRRRFGRAFFLDAVCVARAERIVSGYHNSLSAYVFSTLALHVNHRFDFILFEKKKTWPTGIVDAGRLRHCVH